MESKIKKSRRDEMNRIITLLNEKNHYLEKFYSLNEKELIQFLEGNFDSIENFYNSREKILEIIKYVDSQIEQERIREGQQKVEDAHKLEIRRALAIKDQYVERILEQDLQILSCIEATKNSLIKELQGIRKNKKAVGGYKHKTFNHRLDEEA
jgi:hypothetical protein